MARVTTTGTFRNRASPTILPQASDHKRRPVLITGGAPRVAVDAIRYLTVHATGTTAVELQQQLVKAGLSCDLLLGVHAAPGVEALRYDSRDDLERGLQSWLALNPEGLVVMAAAINDYQVAALESVQGATTTQHDPGAKIPSGADELVIRLRPASKIIDRLRSWGLRGPLVAFKYEAADTVVASAQSLRARSGASLVVANSLDGSVQALVDAIRVQSMGNRAELIAALAERLVLLASR
jgi:phosphopantothenoylcysteine synthetase/decarboxylase